MTTAPKILCVSLNPAIDRRIRLPHFHAGQVNRARIVDPAAGGKAAHVAYAAAALGADVRWLALLGGPEGENCRAGIEARGITPLGVPIAARTRTNLELIDETTGQITEVLEPGPAILDAELSAFREKFEHEIRSRPIVVLSGSLPQRVPNSFYADLTAAAKRAHCPVLLDTSGESLAASLAAAPDVIKPNRQEAAALLNRKLHSHAEAFEAASELRRRGPKTVILSLGAEGAIVVEDRALIGKAPKVEAISTVGSGDSFLAGWAFAMAQALPLEDRLRLAIACGTANCLAESPGMISKEAVQRFSQDVEIYPF